MGFFQEVFLLWTGAFNKKKQNFSNRCFYSELSSNNDKIVWYTNNPKD